MNFSKVGRFGFLGSQRLKNRDTMGVRNTYHIINSMADDLALVTTTKRRHYDMNSEYCR